MFQSLAKFGVRKNVASNDDLDIQHAAILHIDIVGSSQQVQKNLLRAHRQIQSLYNRLAVICSEYGGLQQHPNGVFKSSGENRPELRPCRAQQQHANR